MDNLSGQHIKGYEVLESIGSGGFGAVYRAYQPVIEREVAIKVILPEHANHPEFIRRFETEAQLVARLEHIHIVPLYDYWRDRDGAFLVMRWLRGGSLRAALNGNNWDSAHAPKLIGQVAAALAVAHRRGVVHQDIKPANVLLDEEGNAFLADFGIALRLGDDSIIETDDDNAMVSATPAYASPEQIRSQTITPRSDIYSFGVMMYEILCGSHPFKHTDIATMLFKHLRESLPSIHLLRPDLPAALDSVIQRATAKDFEDRYPDMRALMVDFHRALTQPLTPDMASHPAAGEPVSYVTEDVEFITGVDLPEFDNPYKGLRAFQEADSADFFGRDVLIPRLIERLKEPDRSARFLAVVGPSGSGKSSVVHAGVLPLLRLGAVGNSDNWYIAEMTPGAHPMQELEAQLLAIAINPPENLLEQLNENERGLYRALKRTLPDDDSEFLLVIDQFEEIFTQVSDENERLHFLDSLVVALSEPDTRLRLIITLRADFYDKPLLYPVFGGLVRVRTEVVLPLDDDELQQAIVGPAKRIGLVLETGLVPAIIDEVRGQPGSLPLLQYALTELFEKRDGRRLTLRAYQENDGVQGALARRAEELYLDFDARGRHAVRQLFLRLITPGEGTDDTRRRAIQSELTSLGGDVEVMKSVINTYGKYRLLTFDHDPETRVPTIEVAHEALLREWGRLREWIEDSREDVLLQRRLHTASREWLNHESDESFLAMGVRLQQFERLLSKTDITLNRNEVAFIEASISRRKRQQQLEADQQARELALQRRATRRLQGLVAVMLVATIIALGLTAFAFNQGQVAQENAATAVAAQGVALAEANSRATQQAIAERSATENQSFALAASAQRALIENNTDLAITLALTANDIDNPPIQTQHTLAQAAYAPGTRFRLVGHNAPVNAVAIHPNGTLAVSGSTDGSLRVWDLQSGELLNTINLRGGAVLSVAFSPTGRLIAAGMEDNSVRLWDIDNRIEQIRLSGHQAPVASVAFSPDGRTLASGSVDRTIRLWDTDTGEVQGVLDWHFGTVYSLDFNSDGTQLVSGSGDWSLIIWDVNEQAIIHEITDHEDEVRAVVFTPDDRYVISASWDNTVAVWDVESGEMVRQMSDHHSPIFALDVNSTGETLISGDEEGFIIVHDFATGMETGRRIGHDGAVLSLAYLPDGRSYISTAFDSTMRLWERINGAEITRFTHSDTVLTTQISPDHASVLSGDDSGQLLLWNVQSGEVITPFEGHSGAVNAAVFSPTESLVASASDDRTIRIWDSTTGETIRTITDHTNAVTGLAFSPDGELLASSSLDASVRLWDVDTGEAVGNWIEHGAQVWSIAYSPDGRTLLSGAIDGAIILWDVETGAVLQRLTGHAAGVYAVAYHPDSTRALSASRDGTIILWNLETGAQISIFEGHSEAVRSIAFSPDGRLALSGGDDGAIILWDVATSQELRRFTEATGSIRSVAFSADGRMFVSGSEDGSARLWRNHSLSELIAWTRGNRYVRDFTCAERTLFRLPPC